MSLQSRANTGGWSTGRVVCNARKLSFSLRWNWPCDRRAGKRFLYDDGTAVLAYCDKTVLGPDDARSLVGEDAPNEEG